MKIKHETPSSEHIHILGFWGVFTNWDSRVAGV